MAIAEAALIAIGGAVSKTLLRLWVADGTPIGDAADAFTTKVIEAKIPELLRRKRTIRAFEAIGDQIAQKLERFFVVEYGGLRDNEMIAAANCVAASIDSMRFDTDDLVKSNLNSRRLEQAVLESRTCQAQRETLDEAGKRFHDLLLNEACNYIVDASFQLPNFREKVTKDLLEREDALRNLVITAIRKIPSQSITAAHEDDELFLTQYRREIARKLDRVELPGLNLSGASSRYSLSAAYVSLRVVNRNAVEGVYVEAALAEAQRQFVRGEAGSGKSTLLDWLAVRAARSDFEEPLAQWNGLTPVIFRLRNAKGKLPSLDELIASAAPIVADQMPAGWTRRQISKRGAILLVDGVDEVPAEMRMHVQEWLEDLIAQHDRSLTIIVTSRPTGAPASWLEHLGFNSSLLLSMRDDEIDQCIAHWHRAAAQNMAREDRAQVLGMAGPLIARLKETPTLHELASTPLLCAMLSALNHDRRARLPSDRVQLYRLATEVMLSRRSSAPERTDDSAGPKLAEDQKSILLQELAFWMMANGLVEASKEDVSRQFALTLRQMPTVTISPSDLADAMLQTSGILREPVPGQVDFTHRSFQEYFCALSCVQRDYIGLLLSKVEEDTWRQTTILVAGLCINSQREELLSGLLQHAASREQSARPAILLAAACLETSPTLSREISQAIKSALQEVVPPRNKDDVVSLASAGELTIPFLRWSPTLDLGGASASVRTLARIGSEAAMRALVPYAEDDREEVQVELVEAWPHFTPTAYARDVLSKVRFSNGRIRVTEPTMLPYVGHVASATAILGRFPTSDQHLLASLPVPDHLRELDVSSNPHVIDLRFIDGKSALQSVVARRCPRLRWIGRLTQQSNVAVLDLSDCSLEDIYGIQQFSQIRILRLGSCAKLSTIAPIGTLGRTLEELDIRGFRGISKAWAPLKWLTALTSLTVSEPIEAIRPWVENLPELRRVYVDRNFRTTEDAVVSGPNQAELDIVELR